MHKKSVARTLGMRATVELGRVAAKRPHLADRCERAAGILTRHVTEHGGEYASALIRPRVRGGNLVAYLISGSSGQTYRIQPSGKWPCSCPDHHRRDAACKHALACWALHTASTSAPCPAVVDALKEMRERKVA